MMSALRSAASGLAKVRAALAMDRRRCGSATSAAAALLGMQEEMSADELDELEKLIGQAREGRAK